MGISPLFPLAMFGIWILFSGKIQVFHLSVGVAAVILVTWLSLRLVSRDEAARPKMRIFATVWYVCWLAVQMVLSAIYVMRVIVNPKKHLDPRIVELHSPQPSNLSRVLLANSITLTPGTLTVDLEDDMFVVHALTQKTADDLLTDDMGRRVAALSRVSASDDTRAETRAPAGEENVT
jgi:multicomponent Na+:H+ antiporter subunit E